jgi:dipeptide/tripeptide permease
MMGVWFLSIAVGIYSGSWVASKFQPSQDILVKLFGLIAVVTIGGAVILVFLTPYIKRLEKRSDTQ